MVEEKIRYCAEMLAKVLEDAPCNYNDMDELVDEWCEKNCGLVPDATCWAHAIESGWIKEG